MVTMELGDYHRLFDNLEEDEVEESTALLEEKDIPRTCGGQQTSIDVYKRPKTLFVDKNCANGRSFHRKHRIHNDDNQYLKVYESNEMLQSPAVARRRSSSIAVPQPITHDLSYMLQKEKPSSRSQSPRQYDFRNASSGYVNATPQRNRTCSMPTVSRQQKPMLSHLKRQDDDDDDEYYRLRSFSITPNGVCKNLGDRLKTRRSRSTCSVDSTLNHRRRLSGARFLENNDDVPVFTVGLLGAPKVGKTTLSCQFATSEYICAYDKSLDEGVVQRTVSISLNGQEAEFNIIDIPSSEISVETFCYTFNVDVFVVVYSIIDAQSFKVAQDILLYLWKNDYMSTKGVILVANKTDLERSREISINTGRKLALSWKCKFIETSSGIDHNVNELLVGIFAQVQLNPKRCRNYPKTSKDDGKQLFWSILNFGKKAKSCENLFVL